MSRPLCCPPLNRIENLRFGVIFILWTVAGSFQTKAAEIHLTLKNGQEVVEVGALNRWDQDGNPREPLDPKASIDRPAYTATATQSNNKDWIFRDLPAGRYDLVIQLRNRVRLEGFHYPPVLEFDPVMRHGTEVEPDVRDEIVAAIRGARHYENRVSPLYLTRNNDCVRVLVQLLRDQPTSYDAAYGRPVATIRHEIWQFTDRYGAWTKEQRTRVLDRILMSRQELRSWTWLWVPDLGGLEIAESSVTRVRFTVPQQPDMQKYRGFMAD